MPSRWPMSRSTCVIERLKRHIHPRPTMTMLAVFGLLLALATSGNAATSSRLPDGTEFVFWEQPLTFTKTYYVDGASPRSDDRGPGSSQQPFRTISRAAEVLLPGERVLVAAGTYRECVRPARGGTGADKMISYEAAPGAEVIVKGSEILREGWERGTEQIWKYSLPGAL